MNIGAETLSLKRCGLLLKRDALSSYRAMLIRIAAASGILLLVDLMTLWSDGPQSYRHIDIFIAVLFVGGFIFSSASFKEAHRKELNQAYFLLPASPLEKVVSRIVGFTLGWILLVALWYTLFTLLSFAGGELILGQHHPLYSPFHPRLLEAFAHYIVLQAIFLVGSIYFRRNQFFKTLLAGFVLTVLFAMIMAIFVRIVFASYFTGFFIPDESLMQPFQISWASSFGPYMNSIERVMKVIYWGLAAPAAWVFTYIRFREVQVNNGV